MASCSCIGFYRFMYQGLRCENGPGLFYGLLGPPAHNAGLRTSICSCSFASLFKTEAPSAAAANITTTPALLVI